MEISKKVWQGAIDPREISCIGCGVCEMVCPRGSICVATGPWGDCYPVVDRDTCTGCGICLRQCPAAKPPLRMRPRAVYAAWSRNQDERHASSSGGAAAVFSRDVIQRGGVVFGAAFSEKGAVFHRCIQDQAGLEALKGSKYVKSDLANSYRRVHALLMKDREVLFIGTPCQVDGLYAYLRNNYGKLTTIDLICHGAPDGRFFQEYLTGLEKKSGRTAENIAFRGAAGYCLTLYEDGRPFYQADKKEDLYYLAFLTGLLAQDCCLQCPYACTGRVGDLTLGDFWGLGDSAGLKGNLSDGVSEILVNTQKGEKVFARCQQELCWQQRTLEEAEAGNQTLRAPAPAHPKREAFRRKYLRKGFAKAAGSCLRKELRKGRRG